MDFNYVVDTLSCRVILQQMHVSSQTIYVIK